MGGNGFLVDQNADIVVGEGLDPRTSCDVRNPSKKWRNGTRPASVAAWEMQAKSGASWTELEASKANPV